MRNQLDIRLAELLSQSVEEYIKSAAPIASAILATRNENHLSSATIRNDLKILEQLGYLRQIHTTGGRVPTESGYRAYINATHDPTFASDLINDLAELKILVDRIDRKINGTGAYPIRASNYNSILERRQNIYRLLEIPDLDTSAFYLIIKERLDGRKN
jgi:hypothetical protein